MKVCWCGVKVCWCEGVLVCWYVNVLVCWCEGVLVWLEGYMDMSCTGGGGGGNIATKTYPGPDLPFTAMT